MHALPRLLFAAFLVTLALHGCIDAPDDDDDDSGDDDDSTPDPCADPAPTCEGLCALSPPTCTPQDWRCDAPGMELDETSCDGFDNDCGSTVGEGVCPDCTSDVAAQTAALTSIWDIDFDFDCNSRAAHSPSNHWPFSNVTV